MLKNYILMSMAEAFCVSHTSYRFGSIFILSFPTFACMFLDCV